MVSWPYVITVTGLAIYTFHAYLNQYYLISIHCLYTICLIIYNTTISQSDPKFTHLHPPPIPTQTQTHPNKQNKNQKQQPKTCSICSKIKPPRYYHCRKCNTCIYQMDHHCDWLNCCVGQFNCKIYLQILINLFVVGCGSFWRVFGMGGSWLDGGKIFGFIVSGFLVWQVGRMGIGVGEMIQRNQTLIQTYKRVRGGKKTRKQKLVEIFGGGFGLSWFIPTYSDCKNSDPFEKTYPITKQAALQPKQYTYADEYLYGSDDQQQPPTHKSQ